MAKEQNNVSIAKRVLRDFLGLDAGAIEKVVRVIKSEGMLPELKTQVMRRRVGPRAMTLLNKSLEAAAEVMAKNKEGEDVADEAPEKREEKKEVKESTFLKFLMTEMEEDNTVDYTGTDDSKLDARQKAAKRKQLKDDPTKRRLDKEMSGADTMQKKIAAENKRHQMAIKKIKDAERETGE